MSATDMRIILFLVGLVVLALIYLFGRPMKPGQANPPLAVSNPPWASMAQPKTTMACPSSRASSWNCWVIARSRKN